jgi:hypothetical protein
MLVYSARSSRKTSNGFADDFLLPKKLAAGDDGDGNCSRPVAVPGRELVLASSEGAYLMGGGADKNGALFAMFVTNARQ